MGFFRKSRDTATHGHVTDVQPPDEHGRRAQMHYGNNQFVPAAEAFGVAIDKMHTMYVIGGMRFRQPSNDDSYIVEGLVSSIGAARAMDPGVDLTQIGTRAVHYLEEIADAVDAAGYDAASYREGIEGVLRELC